MAKLKYFIETGSYDCGERGVEYEGEYFEYSPDQDELINAIAELALLEYLGKGARNALVARGEYKKAVEGMGRMIEDNDLEEEMIDKFYDDLKDWFEDDALEAYERV